MRVAQDERLLKRRVDDYLWRDQSTTLRALRAALDMHFSDFEKVSIFGGMLRDLARLGKSGFKSDIDLVIDAPIDQVDELAARMSAKSNSFGGYGFSTDRWKIDFWALETTWTLRQGHVQATSIDELLEGTFFDWDAVHYDIKQRRLFAQEGYFERLRKRTLGVNVVATPSAVGNAARAVRRLITWDLRASEELLMFVEGVVRNNGLEALVTFEEAKYSNSVCAEFKTPDKLMSALVVEGHRSKPDLASPRQLELPGCSEWI